MRSDQRFALIVLTAFALCGCGAGTERTLEEVSEQNFALNPDATISINNRDGSIRIYGSDKPELIVQSIKKAYTAARLKEIEIKIAAQPGAAMIDTIYPPQPKRWSLADRSGTVDYNIIVPQTGRITSLELTNGEVTVEGMRGAGVNAKLTTGRIASHNCFCDLHLVVAIGNLDVLFDWWEKTKFTVLAEGTDGHIFAALPTEASFTLDAESVTGNVVNVFGETKEAHSNPTHHLQTTIGTDAGADLKFHTINGNIKVEEF